MEKNNLSFVPQCFQSSLEFVQLKVPITVTETPSKLQLAIYFIRNCVVLKKLMVNESFGNVMNEVRKIPKRASACEVVMLAPACEDVSHGSSLLPVIYKDMFIPKILDQ
ncbi:FBD domain [Arabidopsis thaliana x Arabidopsis arenosa]|uniref:FBD domain n=1 Tax=Arabidopsis thaliana x Arabidopsis arenosa TaxID=1240361 RepID=A0A8T2GXE1_9BRAS|nr:FBD domain [Arabidopsis thaliana x Arabidopsis arenosa]